MNVWHAADVPPAEERRSRANHPTALRVEHMPFGDGSELRIIRHPDGFVTAHKRSAPDAPWQHSWTEPPLFGADL